ncbi:Na+/H+ antiporter NhaC [Ureibacillus sinduriensis]|uniref:Sodium:proton antiporter n=1 Tax=Ureibacillus sinduriensis BLB-1 = JCM 15800 TaxID=1384057 RepID=A0A0A3HQV4_9BACL|nr:Na+/H+ antiporter NhaC [Ureibacillus sinduriensis]KGR74976.1 sodium:proton antiporter [Ureibacillus sinduriensis BLB-1 = JCM 15800]
MFSIEAKTKPSVFEALITVIVVICIISIAIGKLDAVPHIPILLSIILLIFYGLLKRVPFKELEESMKSGVMTGIGAIYIFFLIGILISSWIVGGTIPTLLYMGFTLVSASFFYAIVFIITAIIGIAIGSSLTTVATVGVAFVSIAGAIDASMALTAGAIVSGAFFGDKMSPLSDTTNLAASIINIDLFVHIKNMSWTTIPAFIISGVLYAVLSPSTAEFNNTTIAFYQDSLKEGNFVHWYAIVPLLVLIVCTYKKVPAFLTLIASSLAALFLSIFHTTLSVSDYCAILYSGYVSETGVEVIDSLLTRGGISSMFFTIMLVVLSLSMGGLMFALGIIQTLLGKIENLLNSVGALITGTAFTAIGINLVVGEQYLSILLTGEAFKQKFRDLGLHPKNLSRVMEDAGTVVNPLVPWSVCGLFIASMLDVSVIDYLPFAFFCLLSPVLTILFGWLNLTITRN